MAITATINTIERRGGCVSVDVTYADTGSDWTADRTFDFPDDGSVDVAGARAQILTQGVLYRENLATDLALAGYIGQTIEIP